MPDMTHEKDAAAVFISGTSSSSMAVTPDIASASMSASSPGNGDAGVWADAEGLGFIASKRSECVFSCDNVKQPSKPIQAEWDSEH